MVNIKRILILAFSIFLTAAVCFAETPSKSELTKRYLEKASELYDQQNYEEAYKTVNSALALNESSRLPANVVVVAEEIYTKILDEIKTQGNYEKFREVAANINKYPQIAAPKIEGQVEELYAQQDFDAQNGMSKALAKVSETAVLAVFAVFLSLFLILIVVTAGIRVIVKSNRRQSEQFEETLKQVAVLQQMNNQILLGSITDLQKLGPMHIAGSSDWGKDALPAPEFNEKEKEELKQLAYRCEDLGAKIDMVTRRKNNSKNVSELVYKLAVALGCNQNTAMAYFCAAMVYDAGFLAVPEEFLSAEELSPEQREVINDHVNKTEEYFDFVPEMFKKIFDDAAKYHHENEDGSGYPEQIKGDDIPQVAKLIHVAESYVSLVSKRTYRQITDKESAVCELMERADIYDSEVVKALDSIV